MKQIEIIFKQSVDNLWEIVSKFGHQLINNSKLLLHYENLTNNHIETSIRMARDRRKVLLCM